MPISKYQVLKNIFRVNNNSPDKQLIILSVKDVIYLKRKTGKRMTLGDLKRCLQKDPNITRLHDIVIRNGDTFDPVWNTFLIDLREDSNTKIAGTYYDIIPYFIGAPSLYRPYLSIIQYVEQL